MRKLLGFAVAIIIILIIGGLVSRSALDQRISRTDDTPIFTSTYTLEATKTDDLFVIADAAQLLAGSHVEADAALVGRTRIDVDGLVDGDLTAMGGDISIGTAAYIRGDAALIGNHITLGGQIDGDLSVVADTLSVLPGAQISSQLDLCVSHFSNESTLELSTQTCGEDELAGWTALRDGSLINSVVSQGGFSVSSFIVTGILALAAAALAGLVVTIFPRPFAAMTEAVRSLPSRTARVGCFTQILIAALVAGLVVVIALLPPLGLVLLPILALLALPMTILFVVGWMTMALLTGNWILHLFKRTDPPMLTVIIGTLGLFLFWTLVAALPYGRVFGLLIPFILGTVGMGAAILTRVGTRSAGQTYFVQG